MNNEIKEILDKLKDTADTSFFAVCSSQEELDKMPKSITKILSISSKDAKMLLDYITNLQQENERLKETNVYCNRTDCVGRIKDSRKYDSVYQKKEDYKSRCEKAIEYIDKQKKKMYKSRNKIAMFILMKLENILQNGSKNE